MRCPECKAENRPGAKFCKECGCRFERPCPECASVNQPGSKFCDRCGYDLGKTTDLPPSESGEPDVKFQKKEGERKYVTALFSDLSGYTAMGERLDPEEVKEITGGIFRDISSIVSKYDGFIEKFAGDAVMALFGAEIAHEDDPIRAIRAAREIHSMVKSVSPRYERMLEQPLAMHTGINTGLVVTGELNVEKGTHGVAGDTLAVAARLSDLGRSDEILVGPDTYRQAEGYFDFEKLEVRELKGRSDPVPVYKVIAPKDRPVKIHGLRGLKAGLIGRKVEMSQLADCVQDLREAKPTVVSIIGNAGTGKSRLVEEFKNRLDLNEIRWLEGQAFQYSQNTPYAPLINLFSRALQIEEGDPPEKVREKVESGISSLTGAREDVVAYVGSLFSLSHPRIDQVSPEYWKVQLQKAVQVVLTELTHRAPTVICLEDLHWADPSFLELSRFFLSAIKDPVLFLCVYRPSISLLTTHQINSMKGRYKEIRLHDLSPSESQDMVGSMLKTESPPPELRAFILDKAEGNPFYIEEVINSLLQSETLVRDNGRWKVTKQVTDSDISPTIHGVIAGRLDRLEKETKKVLQEASVIGRAFMYEILRRITELRDHFDRCLSGLERLDFIKTRTIQPELEYIFKHALTQEVVYNGLLKKERREIHERIGLEMERLFHNRLPEFYETLSFHFIRGHSIIKAVEYLMKSGEKSLKRYALEEADHYYAQAFELLSTKPTRSQTEDELLIDLIIKWAYVFYYRGDIKGWTELFLAHKALADSLEDRGRAGMFQAWLGFAFLGNDNQESKRLLEEALRIGEEVGNRTIIAYAYTWLIFTYADLGLMELAVQCGKAVHEMGDLKQSDPYLYFKPLAGMAIAYWQKGDTKKLLEMGEKLVEYGQQHSNIRSETMGHMALGGVHLLKGDYQAQTKCFERAIEVSADPWYQHISMVFLSLGYILNDQLFEAEKPLRDIEAFSNQNNTDWIRTPGRVMQGIVLIAKGKMGAGRKMIEEALVTFIRGERRFYVALTEHILGKIYLQMIEGTRPVRFSFLARNLGFLMKNIPFADKKAEAHFKKAIRLSKELGASNLLGQAYLDLGRLHKAKKRSAQAKECISASAEIFEQGEAEVFLKKAREELKSLG